MRVRSYSSPFEKEMVRWRYESISFEQQKQTNGCRVIYCEGDADVDIVMIAIMLAQGNHVIVVGEDTDLLVLLLNHSNE